MAHDVTLTLRGQGAGGAGGGAGGGTDPNELLLFHFLTSLLILLAILFLFRLHDPCRARDYPQLGRLELSRRLLCSAGLRRLSFLRRRCICASGMRVEDDERSKDVNWTLW